MWPSTSMLNAGRVNKQQEVCKMQQVRSREELLQYLKAYSEDRSQEIDERKTLAPLLKTYVIETFAESSGVKGNYPDIFTVQDHFCQIVELDDALLAVYSEDQMLMGYLEKISDRFLLFHTTEKAEQVDKFVPQLVKRSIYLDQLWLSGLMFNQLWEVWIAPQHQDHRYIRISFDYHDRFAGPPLSDEHLDAPAESEESFVETRSTKATLNLQKAVLNEVLAKLQETLPSFRAISALRFPAFNGIGGHDFFYNGKVTNRSNSFLDHYQQICDVCANYAAITETLEKMVWLDAEPNRLSVGGEGYCLNGLPVQIIFKDPLSIDKLQYFIKHTFELGYGPFRLWGNPIYINENLVHVYGLDLHLWQEIYLELTPERFLVILPPGTCGNTIHRLVTNIQMALEPNIDVYIGNRLYQDIIRQHLLERRK